MKKKLLAVVLSVVMIAALFVPMMAISAADAPTATIGLGVPYKTTRLGNDGVTYDVIALDVNLTNNGDEQGFFTARYKVISEEGLEQYFSDHKQPPRVDNGFDKGDYTDGYSSLNTTAGRLTEGGKTWFQIVQDSTNAYGIYADGGKLVTVYFHAPEATGTYHFTLEWMDGTDDTPVQYNMTVNPSAQIYSVACTNHVAGAATVTKEATCTAAGEKVVKCTKCGAEMSKEAIPAKGHTAGAAEVTKAATCTEKGEKVTKCTVCQAIVKTEEIAALGHTAGAAAVTKEATCTAAGEKVTKCTVCQAEMKKEAIPAKGHTYDGDTDKDCNVCGEVRVVVDPNAPKANIGIGTPRLTTRLGNDGVTYDVIAIDVNLSGNGDEQGFFTARYKVISEEGLVPYFSDHKQPPRVDNGFDKGDYTDGYSSLNTTAGRLSENGKTWFQVVQDSTNAYGIYADAGKLVTVYFLAPEEAGTYNFTLEWMDGTDDTPVQYNMTVNPAAATYTTSCDHVAGEAVVTKEATCTEAGEKVVKCTKCGTEMSKETIPAKGHTAGAATVTKEATCDEAGEKVTKCTVCQAVLKTEAIPALGHNMVADEANSTEATCTEAGVAATKCTRCDYKVAEEIPALGHTAGAATVTKDATCTEKGEKVTKCTVCQTVLNTEEIPALGHKWDGGKVAEDVACGDTADVTYTCETCGETKVETGAVVNHDMVADEANSKVATCTEAGVEATKCTRCDYTETKEIPALGHTEGEATVTKEATCTEKGEKTVKCTVCDVVIKTEEIAALGHTEGEAEVTKAATCTEKGEKTVKCTVCGEVVKTEEIAALGHTEGEATVTKEATCGVAGEKTVKCTVCGETLKTEAIPALEHAYDNDTDATCNNCGEIREVEIPDGAPTAKISLGTPYKTTRLGNDGVTYDVIAIDVNLSENGEQGFFTARYKVISEEGLKHYYSGHKQPPRVDNGFDKGDFTDGYSELNITVGQLSEGGKTWFQVVQDSTNSYGIYADAGKLITVYFFAPEELGTYNFTLEWMDGTDDTPTQYFMTVDPAKATYTAACDAHVEGEAVVTKEATCDEAGEKAVKCTVCDAVLKTEVIPALGHDMVADEANSTEATCTEAGVAATKCTRCDHKVAEEIPALGHKWDEGKVAEDVACGDTADITYTCETCGETKVETGAVVEHNMVADEANSKAADCTEAGVEAKKCTRCDYTETKEIPALGHALESDQYAGSAPTCTEDGKVVDKCTRCDYVEETVIPALGHTEGAAAVTKEATCTEAGEKTIKCTECDVVLKTEEIAALGHDIVADEANSKAPTCYAEGVEAKKCTRCDYTETKAIDKTAHDFSGEKKVVLAPTAEAEGKYTIACVNEGCTEVQEFAIPKLETSVEIKGENGDVNLKADDAIIPDDITADIEKEDDKIVVSFGSETVDLKGTVEVTFAVELEDEKASFKVTTIGADGKEIVVNFEFKNGFITFDADLTQEYVITEVVEDDKTDSAPTGDAANTVVFAVIALMAVAGLVVVGKKKFAVK